MNLRTNPPGRRWQVALFICFVTVLCGIAASHAEGDGFQDLSALPNAVTAVLETGAVELSPDAHGIWRGAGLTVETEKERDGLAVELIAPGVAVKSLRLTWNASPAPDFQYLGDAWERAYGDLAWQPLDGRRVMPWYFLAGNGRLTHGYGVKTGAGALCYWTVTPSTIVLDADVRCGGSGVQLGRRELEVCTVICRSGHPGETPFAAAREFCGLMCLHPKLPAGPVYGFNDWYCSYGHDTAEEFLKNAGYLVSLAPKTGARPFAVVDDGWEVDTERAKTSELWNRVNPKFSTTLDMAQFAKSIQALGGRPGLWWRPLLAGPELPAGWRLARDREFLDPTVPEVRAYLKQTMERFHAWGFELIKHDYTTYDLLGRWGKDMGDRTTADGWAFADRSQTTAEVIRGLYLDLRKAAGPQTLILGCNTIGHLSAGIFEMQRIGDDTSGQEWARTRKMGVNCLAFRGPQHNRFFAVDADCAGQTTADSVPWEKNRQWLDLLSHSGTVLFTSFPRTILNAEQEQDLRAALTAAARPQPLGEPLDWQQQMTPERWWLDGKEQTFSW